MPKILNTDIASDITAYIVNNFTNMPLEARDDNGDMKYYGEAQEIYDDILNLTANDE